MCAYHGTLFKNALQAVHSILNHSMFCR